MRVDRRFYMQPKTFVDAVTPVFTGGRPSGAPMHLTGTLRQQGSQYLIERQLTIDAGSGPHWTTPRVHRIMATEATRDALRDHLDQVVTITGTVGGADTRNRTAIIVEEVRPL